MGPSRTPASPSPAASAGVVAGMLAMIVIPAVFALRSVATPGKLTIGPNPSPHGYTWSLLLFLVPIVAILGWFLPSEHLTIAGRRAFLWTSVILGCLGCALDFVFAHCFFLFPNLQATLYILVPALGHRVPVEEYIFYFSGFITILLVYVWLSEYWLAAYTVTDYAAEAQALDKLVKFHLTSLILGLVLIAAAVIYKKQFSSVPDGWPGYFIVLVAGGLIPAASSFPATSRFINWRALSLTIFFILLISLLWEATLALPYGWWNYQHPAMVGIFIGAWLGLPIEAVMVWLAVTYATVIVFEAVKIWQASGRPAKEMFLGRR